MPSRALQIWKGESARALDALELAHRTVRSGGRGSRFAAEQVGQAYVLLLSSRFQQYCRDLHTECAKHVMNVSVVPALRVVLWTGFIDARRLDTGNPHPGSIGADFGRMGIRLWEEIRANGAQNVLRQRRLEELMSWRNAIAHQDFRRTVLQGRRSVALREVRRWRTACDALASEMDCVMALYLTRLTGSRPWEEFDR
jgi:hypothetical protein